LETNIDQKPVPNRSESVYTGNVLREGEVSGPVDEERWLQKKENKTCVVLRHILDIFF